MRAIQVFIFVSLICSLNASLIGAQAQNYNLPSAFKFNVTDKSMISNGNAAIALQLMQNLTPPASWQQAEYKTVSDITRNPYAFLGTLCKINGTVYKIEAIPPGPTFKGQWYEILMLSDNLNSAMGATTVIFLYNGNALRIPPRSKITCVGYFVGVDEDKNMFGGTVEGIVIIGNATNLDRPRPRAPIFSPR
ncbi:MAG: hypothetical protein ABSF52_10225 [Syntrophobacteraceae bacterium]|jgi:hypothetical protein